VPEIIERPEQPYLFIPAAVTMQSIGPTIPELLGELFGWSGRRGIEPAGPPLVKYNLIDMEREMLIEVGIPVATPTEGDDRVQSGTLPAGRYAHVLHVGHPTTLVEATGQLLDWAKQQGLTFDEKDDRWAARLEIYLSDPDDQPDLNKWETELAFKLAD
jgi:effector-binding domain-containing protein